MKMRQYLGSIAVALVLLFGGYEAAAKPITWSFGPFAVTTYDDNATPDSIQLYSKTALTAAPALTVADPLPPVGSTVMLQIDIPGVFVLDVDRKIEVGDTPASVAAYLAAVINAGAGNPDNRQALQAAGVVGGNTPGQPQLSVTNPRGGGVVTLLDISGLPTPAFAPTFTTGHAAWDAGPIIACGKIPEDATGKGIAPPPGSNDCQLVIAAYDVTGKALLQFMTIGFNVRDAKTGDMELAVYTQNTNKQILVLSVDGLFINGRQIGAQ